MPRVDQKNASYLVSLVEIESVSETNVLYFQSIMHFLRSTMYSHYYRVKVLFLWWLLLIFSVETTAIDSVNKERGHGKSTPWSKVYLSFYHDFPRQKAWKEKVFSGCQLTLKPVVSGVTGAAHSMMRCLEQVMLLRPKIVTDNWEKQQKEQGYVTLNFPEFGLTAIQAHITAITPSVMDINGLNPSHSHKNFITSIFIRHVLDVRQYTFKNIKGTYDKINVTPEHLFYVKNKHAFMPVSQISMHDRLITDNGAEVRLACHKNRQNCCSQSYMSGQIKPVYNLEVYNKHTYFVGDLHLLVHNICELAKKLQPEIGDLIKVDKDDKAYLHIKTDEDLKRATLAFNGIRFIQSDVKTALALSRLTSIPLPVEKIQPILDLHLANNLGSIDRDTISKMYKRGVEDLFFPFGDFSERMIDWETLHTIFKSPQDKYAILCADRRWFILEKKSNDEYLFSAFFENGSMSMHNASSSAMTLITRHMTVTKTALE